MPKRAARALKRAAPVSETSSSEDESEILDEDEDDDWELGEVGGFEDVDVAELCALSTTDQDKVIEKVRQKETERYNHEFAALEGKGPGAFSELNVRSFLTKAKFDIKLESCRSRMGRNSDDTIAHRDKARRIATNANRRFIFEKETAAPSCQSLGSAEKDSGRSKSSLGPCVGKMLPGESIIDSCQRLKREAAATNKNKKEDEGSEIEWEDNPIRPPKVQSNKQKLV